MVRKKTKNSTYTSFAGGGELRKVRLDVCCQKSELTSTFWSIGWAWECRAKPGTRRSQPERQGYAKERQGRRRKSCERRFRSSTSHSRLTKSGVFQSHDASLMPHRIYAVYVQAHIRRQPPRRPYSTGTAPYLTYRNTSNTGTGASPNVHKIDSPLQICL